MEANLESSLIIEQGFIIIGKFIPRIIKILILVVLFFNVVSKEGWVSLYVFLFVRSIFVNIVGNSFNLSFRQTYNFGNNLSLPTMSRCYGYNRCEQYQHHSCQVLARFLRSLSMRVE